MSTGQSTEADSRLLSSEGPRSSPREQHPRPSGDAGGDPQHQSGRPTGSAIARTEPAGDDDTYQQLLKQLHSNAGKNGTTGVVPRMIEIRRQLTEFQLHYKFGMDEVLTKINVLREEFEHTRDYSPIEHVNFRLKSLDRILDKVERYGCEPTLEGIRGSIRDIAGIRITTSFVSDAYWVAEMLCSQPDLRVVEVKDYIRSPKPNGYQSLHVIVQVPVFLSNRTEFVYVEVQIRTVAMDFWASLEHKIYYTYSGEVPDDIHEELRDAAEKAAALDRQMAEIRDRVTALKEQAPSSGQGATGPTPDVADRPRTGPWFPDEQMPEGSFPGEQASSAAWKWEDIAQQASSQQN